MTVNQTLADEAVAHAVSLQQYSAGVVRKIISQLNRTDAELVESLRLALNRLPADSFTVQRLALLLEQVRAINADAHKQVSGALNGELEQLAGNEAEYQSSMLDAALPKPVLVRFPIVSVSAQQIYAAATAKPFQGRLLRDWADSVEAGTMVRIRNAVSTGYLEGKSVADIVRGIRGTRANQYADGILQRTRQELSTIVRAAVSHTAAEARNAIVDANGDVIKAVRWVSTLDTKTSSTCRIRDQLQYTAEHKPIGHKVPWLEGPGKLHFNCRSTDVPVTKSWQELGINADELTAKQRASMDGQVPGGMTYNEWLSRQSPARQQQVLGVERYQMLRDGKVKMDDLYTARGEFKSIAQLAGVDRQAVKAVRTIKEAPPAAVKPASLFDESTEAGKWHVKSWNDAPDWMLNRAVEFQKIHYTDTGKGAYAQFGQTINMPRSYDNENAKAQSVWRHETGHIIDVRMGGNNGYGYRSAEADFTDAMNQDTKDLIARTHIGNAAKVKAARNAYLAEYDDLRDTVVGLGNADARLAYLTEQANAINVSLEALKATIKEQSALDYVGIGADLKLAKLLKTIKHGDAERFLSEIVGRGDEDLSLARKSWKKAELSSLSDLIGASTKNKVASYDAGYPGHSKSYYNDRRGYGQQTEAFANLTAIYGGTSQFLRDMVARFMPRLAGVYEDIMK